MSFVYCECFDGKSRYREAGVVQLGVSGGSVQANLAGRGVEVHDLGEEREDLPRLIMGHSVEDARDADFDLTASSGS